MIDVTPATPAASAFPPVGSIRRRNPSRRLPTVVVGGLLLAATTACTGDDTASGGSDRETSEAIAGDVTSDGVATTAEPTTTTSTTTTTTLPPIEYVTDGARVMVANASGVDGEAGRMTTRLADVGYDTVRAVNSAPSASGLDTTQIYFDPQVDAARAVAESLREALGGGSIEVLVLGVPAPTASGDIGDADVLVVMGNDVAEQTLAELQAAGAARSAAAADSSGTSTSAPTTDPPAPTTEPATTATTAG